MVERGLLQQHEWAQRRFANLLPDHVGFTLRIISVGGLPAPPGWAPVWTSLPATPSKASFGGVWSQNIPSVEAVLILVHPFKQAESLRACRLSQALKSMYTDTMPPLLWLCHTIAPEVRPPVYSSQAHIRNFVRASMGQGADSVSTAESEGFRLALDIRMMVTKTHHMTDTFSLLLAGWLKMRQQKTRLERRIHSAKWEYLASKLSDGMIPRIDRTIPAGIPQQLRGGWILGEQTRHGCGDTYLLTKSLAPDHPHGEQFVLRAVPRSQVTTVADMMSLKRFIELMHELSSSQWRHPGITRLFRVFHSTSHIFMNIEFGGDMTLFDRLYIRENSLGEHPDLSLEKVCDIITQSVAAVAHIHTGPQICHRDLKPETFLVDEDDASGLRLKLTDFDMAASMAHPCRACCGSLPFVAPEVVLQEEYEGGPADVWSLSLLMLEVLCRTRVLESALCLAVSMHGDGDREAVAKDIQRHFEAEGRAAELLEEHCRPEVTPLLQKVSPVLRETVRVSAARRWCASQVRDALGRLSVPDVGLEPDRES